MFPRFSTQKSVDDSNLSYFKYGGSNRITRKLEALECALLPGAIGLILLKFAHLTSTSGPYAVPKENWSKKVAKANFSKLVSYLLYTYLEESTEKL